MLNTNGQTLLSYKYMVPLIAILGAALPVPNVIVNPWHPRRKCKHEGARQGASHRLDRLAETFCASR